MIETSKKQKNKTENQCKCNANLGKTKKVGKDLKRPTPPP